MTWIIEIYDFCFQPPPAATPPVSQNEAVTVKQEKTVSYKWRTKAFTCGTEVTCEICPKPIWDLWRSVGNRCSELLFFVGRILNQIHLWARRRQASQRRMQKLMWNPRQQVWIFSICLLFSKGLTPAKIFRSRWRSRRRLSTKCFIMAWIRSWYNK